MPQTRREIPEKFARIEALYEAVDPLEAFVDVFDAPIRSSRRQEWAHVKRRTVDIQKMREIRESCGLSIDRAAALAGVGRNTLQRLEAGDSDPKVSTMLLLLNLYGRIQGERIALDEVVN